MLVMASTMLIGGKLGDLWGRLRAFRIGLVAFAVGSRLTAVAQSVGLLLFRPVAAGGPWRGDPTRRRTA